MQLRDQHVRIVAWVADNRGALCVPLYVCSVHTKQKLRRVVALEEKRMAGRSVAVQRFEVEFRTAGIVQFCRIGMRSQSGSIRSDIVSHKLPKNRPARRSVSQRVRRVINVSAITDTACTSEGMQELLIGLKFWQLREHSRVSSWAKGRIDCCFCSCRRQTVTAGRY